MNSKTNGQVDEVGHSDMARLLEHLSLIPLTFISWLEGKKLLSLLTERLGLSPGRLRCGKSFELRQSTVRRAEEKLLQNAVKHGWSEKEHVARQQSAPSVLAGEPRPYADFIYALEHPGFRELPLTIAFAEEVDRLVIKLKESHAANDLELFKQTILVCHWGGEGIQSLVVDQKEIDKHIEAFRTAQSWDAARIGVQIFFDYMLHYLLAALDVECGAIYFGIFQPRPLFLLMAPKINPKFDLNALDKLSKRNLIYRPVRRLLELSHALMFWIREQHWPDKPVGRKELGEVLDLDDQAVGNLFDGTRKMSAKLFDTLWGKCVRRSRRVTLFFHLCHYC